MTSPESNRADLLRVGIIGAGGLASWAIYPCLHYLPVTLSAVCDLDESRARQNAQLFGGKNVYTDYTRMLETEELDAVIVCVGARGHASLAIDVMDAGLPVYTEKPPAVTAAETYAMLETSRRTGQICMTAFCKRFAPAYRKAHSAVQSPEFGRPSLLTIDWCCGPWYTNDPSSKITSWYTNDTNNARTWFLLDFCIHMIDLSRYMFGEVVEVYARKLNESAYAVTLAFASGAVGALGFTQDRGRSDDWLLTERVELTGGAGESISIPHAGRMVRYSGRDVVEWHETPFAVTDSLVEAGYVGELAEFVGAIRDRREPEASIASSYQTMRLYEAIELAATERRVVQLDEIGETG